MHRRVDAPNLCLVVFVVLVRWHLSDARVTGGATAAGQAFDLNIEKVLEHWPVRYDHLTQKENQEKLRHPQAIGQFGIGLKDALAVCDRRGIAVRLRSPHGDITTAMPPKTGFPDVITLHGVVGCPKPPMAGTDVELTGVSDDDMATAKGFLLRFSDTIKLEETRYGDVLAGPTGEPGRIYVRGC